MPGFGYVYTVYKRKVKKTWLGKRLEKNWYTVISTIATYTALEWK